MSPEAADLIKKMLSKEPKTRLGAQGVEEIKNHKFFTIKGKYLVLLLFQTKKWPHNFLLKIFLYIQDFFQRKFFLWKIQKKFFSRSFPLEIFHLFFHYKFFWPFSLFFFRGQSFSFILFSSKTNLSIRI